MDRPEVIAPHSLPCATASTSTSTSTGCPADDEPCLGPAPQPPRRDIRIVSRDEAPLYMWRPFIEHGYLVGGSHLEAIQHTLCSLNNECLNAWTMIVGGIVTTLMFLYTRASAGTTAWEQMPFFLCWLGSIAHIPFSVGLHCFTGVSEKARKKWRTLDVSVLMGTIKLRCISVASLLPLGGIRVVFWGYIAMAIANYGRFLREFLSRNATGVQCRRSHATLLLTSGMIAGLPLFVGSLQELISSGKIGVVCTNTVIMALLGTIGASVFGCSFPEKHMRGAHYLLNSHMIMHIFVMAIPVCEFLMLLGLMKQRAGISVAPMSLPTMLTSQ